MKNSSVDGRVRTAGQDHLTRIHRYVGLGASVVFALVGLAFLLLPGQVVNLFNLLSLHVGLPPAPEHSAGLYDILAGAYMYLVTVLAFGIYREPHNPVYSSFLISAKAASAVLSILFFALDHPYLIFLTNAVVDGSIAGGFLTLRILLKRGRA